MKSFIIILILLSFINANEDITSLQFEGINTSYKEKEIFIKRLTNPKCLKVGITPENIFGGDLAGEKVPKECQKSFVTSLGVIQPISIDNNIYTVGELEVLKFLELWDFNPEKYALVDARKRTWYEKLTIPHSVNIPYTEIAYDSDFPKDFERNLKLLNIKKDKKGKLDFSVAKEAIVFCNGSWCVQSARAIKTLIKLGYPKKKLFWYRGGLQDWIGLGFTVIKP